MDYPTTTTAPTAPARTYKDFLREWMTGDCRNRDCIDGNVTAHDEHYSTLFRCPVCTRSQVAVREWDGPVVYWSAAELEERMKDRKDVYFDKEYRYRRGMEIMALLKSLTGPERRRR